MNLINNRTTAKLERWTAILSSCDKLGYLTTTQIQRLHSLGTTRNTTRILNDMGTLLSSYREGETVWYLSAAGRREIGSTTVRKKTLYVKHTLLRNECFIAWKPVEWRTEFTFKWDTNVLIADALYRMEKGGRYHALEVDITQSMAVNERKIALYKQLRDSGRWKHGEFPEIVFVTLNESRRKRLESALIGIGRVVTINNV